MSTRTSPPGREGRPAANRTATTTPAATDEVPTSVEHHTGRPCSCGARVATPERVAYLVAYAGREFADALEDAPPADGWLAKRRRADAKRRRLDRWAVEQQRLLDRHRTTEQAGGAA